MKIARKIKTCRTAAQKLAGPSTTLFRTFAGFRGLLCARAYAILAGILQRKQALSLQQGRRQDEHPSMLFRTFAVHITLELMIDEALASVARKKLSEIAGDKWDHFESEIQDGGTYVLLSARIAWGEPKEVAPELESAVRDAMNALIPHHSQQEQGSWMVNVWSGAALVDSIFPNEL